MANEIIDVGFLAAKVAALNDEKAKMAVDGVSLIYNAAQIANFKNLMADYQQILSIVSMCYRVYGSITQDEINIAQQCNDGINFCQQQIQKHGIVAATDIASLIFSALKK